MPSTTRPNVIYAPWKAFPYRYARHQNNPCKASEQPVQGIRTTRARHPYETTRRVLFQPETERVVVGQKMNKKGKIVKIGT